MKYLIFLSWASLVAQPVMNPPAGDIGDMGLIPGSGRSPGGGNDNPHQYSRLKKIPWTEEPGGLQSMGSQRSDMTGRLSNVLLLPTKNLKARFFPLFSRLDLRALGWEKINVLSTVGVGSIILRKPCYGRHGEGECTEALSDQMNPIYSPEMGTHSCSPGSPLLLHCSPCLLGSWLSGVGKGWSDLFCFFSSPRNSPRVPSRPRGAPQEDSVMTCCLDVN